MTRVVRPLLQQGNQKLGSYIATWALEAGTTCPGASETCMRACYARRHRFQFPQVRDRLRENWELAQRPDFVEKMVAEIKKKGVMVLRLHTAGDFATAKYAEKWLAIMKLAPRCRYYFYTRSYRVPEIEPVLAAMAQLRCCRAWYSVDRDTGLPARIPANVRLAFLQVEVDERPEGIQMLFRTQGLRRKPIPRLGLTVLPVCSNEAPNGGSVTCGGCRRCFE